MSDTEKFMKEWTKQRQARRDSWQTMTWSEYQIACKGVSPNAFRGGLTVVFDRPHTEAGEGE